MIRVVSHVWVPHFEVRSNSCPKCFGYNFDIFIDLQRFYWTVSIYFKAQVKQPCTVQPL